MYSSEKIKAFLKKRLSKKRYNHSVNVANEALKLAKTYGENLDKAYFAGLLHDVCKELLPSEQKQMMLEGNMDISGAELATKALWHGPAGAYFIEKEMGIKDKDILNAVRFHTVGRSGMSRLEEIIYMADLISEDRDYKDVDKMRKLAYTDFEKAMLEAFCYSIEGVVKKQGYIPEYTVDAYNQYLYVCSVRKKTKEENNGK
ncbi:bis(5'-nucleosyl)-tetraphosphatase (symmetrical) YqeK [Porcipelethomonas sp.]|uniref:bis(5'-nucleosyl)-tetraphosphatase (symmetrical) YqeK n=1 Tax=Porcipelethomonas sp. TaxID=2981675 RepID=UPI003EF80DAB